MSETLVTDEIVKKFCEVYDHVESVQGHDGDYGADLSSARAALTAVVDGLVRAEREACAKLCDYVDKSTHPGDLADMLRSRKG